MNYYRSQSKPVSPASVLLVDRNATRRAVPVQEAPVSASGEKQPDRSVPTGGRAVQPHPPRAHRKLPGDAASGTGRLPVPEAELSDCRGQFAQHSPTPCDRTFADVLR